MAESTFKEAEAKRWIDTVTEYNQQVETLLQNVTDCINDIQSESEGPMVEALTQVASGLSGRFKELVSVLGNLITALSEVIQKFRQFASDAVESIKGAAKSIVGGLDVSVTV